MRPVTLRTPRDADALGIATVYQDLALCDNLDIVQNMFLGHELLRHRLLDETTMEKTAKQTLADLSVTTVSSVRQLVGSLSGGQRQSVAVARAVMRDARLVIMDEPTAALGVSQTAQVLDLIRRLGERGIAVLVVSHNLTDVFSVADRLAVLYLGSLVSSGPIAEYDTQSVVELITTGHLHADGTPVGGLPGNQSHPRAIPPSTTRTRHLREVDADAPARDPARLHRPDPAPAPTIVRRTRTRAGWAASPCPEGRPSPHSASTWWPGPSGSATARAASCPWWVGSSSW